MRSENWTPVDLWIVDHLPVGATLTGLLGLLRITDVVTGGRVVAARGLRGLAARLDPAAAAISVVAPAAASVAVPAAAPAAARVKRAHLAATYFELSSTPTWSNGWYPVGGRIAGRPRSGDDRWT